MKQRIPYFNFYPSDFIKGVRGLTAQEVGIYTMLLCRIYEENGPVDFHEGRLAAYCGCTEKTIAKVVERLVYLGRLRLVGKQLTDDRAEAEILKRENALKSQSKAGEASAQKRKQNQWQSATDVQRPFNHTDTDTDTDTDISEGKPSDDAQALFPLDPPIPKPKPPPKARLPEDWALSDEGWAYARSQGIPDKVIEDEARGFHAYWTDRRDRDASKSARGWEQCWATRCRNIAGKFGSRGGMAGPSKAAGYGQRSSLASIVARRHAQGEI